MEVNPRGGEGMGGGDERRRRGGSRWVVNCHYGDERVRSRSSAESCNKLNKKLQKNIGYFENKNGLKIQNFAEIYHENRLYRENISQQKSIIISFYSRNFGAGKLFFFGNCKRIPQQGRSLCSSFVILLS